DTLQELEATIEELARQAREEVTSQCTSTALISDPEVTFDLRYVGTDSVITVPAGTIIARRTPAELKQQFAERHLQQFGYTRAERAVELALVRVEVTGSGTTSHPTAAGNPQPIAAVVPITAADAIIAPDAMIAGTSPTPSTEEFASSNVWFDGKSRASRVYFGAPPEKTVPGPAVLCTSTSTIVIDPWSVARILEDGSLLIEVRAKEQDSNVADPAATELSSPESPDPVLLEVFSNQFASIAEQMGEMLRRTAISTNVRERLDYSCALFDQDGQLVVNAPHVPVHLGAMGETVRAVMEDHPKMRPGDVFVTNDPYRGGSHLPDVTVVTPVFASSTSPDTNTDQPVAFVANRAHHAEIGGIVPGSMPPFSRTLAEEGVLIRSRHLVRDGVSCEAELAKLLTSGPYPSRSVTDNLADLTAQTAANTTGVRLLSDLINSSSSTLVNSYMRHIQSASSLRMRKAFYDLADGDYSFRDQMDDGHRIEVKISVQGDQAVIDFAGTADVHPGNLNANRAITTAAVLYTLRCFLQTTVPLNAGVLEPVDIRIPSGLLNPPPGLTPEESPAMVGGNVETSQRIVDVLFGALRLAAASQGTMNNLTFGNDKFGYYETICGGAGATATADGVPAVHTHMTNTRLTDPEVLEQRYPVRLRRFGIRHQSGGAGQFRGGDGVVREIEFLEPLQVSLLSQRRETSPYGLMGGDAGASGRACLKHPNGTSENLPGCFSKLVGAGNVLTLETPGGGGFGAFPDEERG
ncbi:MAG: hydantoinase B/oxoprolinase family protein, partial [Planctomycetaceae bacterium]|nr:hydantoinase B/oxoprolinase family protein [Planctomycetaceae bacterium]